MTFDKTVLGHLDHHLSGGNNTGIGSGNLFILTLRLDGNNLCYGT